MCLPKVPPVLYTLLITLVCKAAGERNFLRYKAKELELLYSALSILLFAGITVTNVMLLGSRVVVTNLYR